MQNSNFIFTWWAFETKSKSYKHGRAECYTIKESLVGFGFYKKLPRTPSKLSPSEDLQKTVQHIQIRWNHVEWSKPELYLSLIMYRPSSTIWDLRWFSSFWTTRRERYERRFRTYLYIQYLYSWLRIKSFSPSSSCSTKEHTKCIKKKINHSQKNS